MGASETEFREQMLNGLVLGSMYAIVASGLTLIWGTMKMLNFAHGELYMIGGYVLYLHPHRLRGPSFLGVFLAMVVVFLVGVLMETRTHPPAPGQARVGREPPRRHPGGLDLPAELCPEGLGGAVQERPVLHRRDDGDPAGFRIAYQRILILVVAAW